MSAENRMFNAGIENRVFFNKRGFLRSLRRVINNNPRTAVFRNLGEGDIIAGSKEYAKSKKDLVGYFGDVVEDALGLYGKHGGPILVAVPIMAMPGSGKSSIFGPFVKSFEKALSRHNIENIIWRADFGDMTNKLYGLREENRYQWTNMRDRFIDASSILCKLTDKFHQQREKWQQKEGGKPTLMFFFMETPGPLIDYKPPSDSVEKTVFLPTGGDSIAHLAHLAAQHPDYFLIRGIGIAPAREIVENAERVRAMTELAPQSGSTDAITKNATSGQTRSLWSVCLANIEYFFRQDARFPRIAPTSLNNLLNNFQRSIAEYIKYSFSLYQVKNFFVAYNTHLISIDEQTIFDGNAPPEHLPPIDETARELMRQDKLLHPI
jgi:hypothetical protein